MLKQQLEQPLTEKVLRLQRVIVPEYLYYAQPTYTNTNFNSPSPTHPPPEIQLVTSLRH